MNVGEVSAIWAALAMAARDSPVSARTRAGFPAGVTSFFQAVEPGGGAGVFYVLHYRLFSICRWTVS
jgi:hypothetical protein